MRQIAGFITEWDVWGRFRVTYPRVRDGQDTLNTEAQIRAFAEKRPGWSPAKKQSYVARPYEKNGQMQCFAYHRGQRVTNFAELVQHNAIFEVEFMPFADAEGWWIRVASIRTY